VPPATGFDHPELSPALHPVLPGFPETILFAAECDPLADDAPPSDDPFRYEGTRLVPHLAGPVSQAATPNLSFFARVYPTASIEMPKLTLDFVRDGKIVGRAQPPLPAPDASGRITYVGGVPSGSFPPGSYEVRLTLTQGTAKVTQSTRFELAP
jgi:hypothetical protein